MQDGTNWYVYCHNNPLAMVDPTGLAPENQMLFSAIHETEPAEYNYGLIHFSYDAQALAIQHKGLEINKQIIKVTGVQYLCKVFSSSLITSTEINASLTLANVTITDSNTKVTTEYTFIKLHIQKSEPGLFNGFNNSSRDVIKTIAIVTGSMNLEKENNRAVLNIYAFQNAVKDFQRWSNVITLNKFLINNFGSMGDPATAGMNFLEESGAKMNYFKEYLGSSYQKGIDSMTQRNIRITMGDYETNHEKMEY